MQQESNSPGSHATVAVLAGITRATRMSRSRRNQVYLSASPYLMVFLLTIFSGYVNSWLLGLRLPSPGSIARDAIFFFLLCYVNVYMAHTLLNHTGKTHKHIFLWWASSLYGLLLFLQNDNILASALGFRNIFFPIVSIAFSIMLAHSHYRREICGMLRSVSVAVMLFISIVGIIDVFAGGNFVEMLGYNPEYNDQVAILVKYHLGVIRANAGVSDALNFGYLMAFASYYSLYLYIRADRSRLLKSVYLMAAFSCACACFLSMTRGAILALICPVLAFLLYQAPKRTVVFALILATAGLPQLDNLEYVNIMLDRFTESDTGSAVSSQQRVDAVSKSFDLLLDSPVTGIGLGTQGAATGYQKEDIRIASDNSFLWILLEMGILGFGLLAASYLFLINHLIRHARKVSADTRLHYLFFVFGALFILFVSASLSSAVVSPTLAIPFWLLLVCEAHLLNSRDFRGEGNEVFRMPPKNRSAC